MFLLEKINMKILFLKQFKIYDILIRGRLSQFDMGRGEKDKKEKKKKKQVASEKLDFEYIWNLVVELF